LILRDFLGRSSNLVPELQCQYEALVDELDKEHKEIAEIQNSDEDYLNELKSSIAEQEFVSPMAAFSSLTFSQIGN
jgi:kinetochore protein Spc7/SPC105